MGNRRGEESQMLVQAEEGLSTRSRTEVRYLRHPYLQAHHPLSL